MCIRDRIYRLLAHWVSPLISVIIFFIFCIMAVSYTHLVRCYNSSHERRGDENTVIVKLISHLMLYILLTVAAIGDFKNYRISNLSLIHI